MDIDELFVPKKERVFANPEALSVEEAEAYIVELEAEIVKVREEIARKKAAAGDAEKWFK